jgi:hypothetical protein
LEEHAPSEQEQPHPGAAEACIITRGLLKRGFFSFADEMFSIMPAAIAVNKVASGLNTVMIGSSRA